MPIDSVPEELLTVESVEDQLIAAEIDAEMDAISTTEAMTFLYAFGIQLKDFFCKRDYERLSDRRIKGKSSKSLIKSSNSSNT